MRLIVNDMEAQHAIAPAVDVKPQKAIKSTNNEDNEEELLIDLLTDVKIYKNPNIANGVQMDKHKAKEENISLTNPKKLKQDKRTGGRSRTPRAAQQQWDDKGTLQAALRSRGRGNGAAKQNKVNKST